MQDQIGKPTNVYVLILVAIVGLSLVRVFTPATHRAASWREALTEVMTKTIAEGHVNPFEAKVTHIHPSHTRFAAEFPIYTRLVAVSHRFVAPDLWSGRLISFAFALLGLLVFYRVLSLVFGDERLSLIATTLLALSNWLIIGTRVMPDVPAAALALSAVLFAHRYLREGKWYSLFAAGLFTLLAGLTKLPALILLLWIAPGLVRQSPQRILWCGLVLLCAAIPCGVYYFQWLPRLVESGAMALMYPTKVIDGLSQVFGSHRSNAIDMILYRGWGGYLLSALGLIGSLGLMATSSRPLGINKRELVVLYGGSLLGLLVFAAKSGSTLATHPYYAIPFLPLLAFGAATLLMRSPKNLLVYAVCMIALVEIGLRHFTKDKQGRAFAELSEQVQEQLPDGPYISGFSLNPQPAYYFDRATWAWSIDNINDQVLREAAKREGAEGIIFPTADTARISFPYRILKANERIAIITF